MQRDNPNTNDASDLTQATPTKLSPRHFAPKVCRPPKISNGILKPGHDHLKNLPPKDEMGPRPRSGNSLERQRDEKVLRIVRRYVDEQRSINEGDEIALRVSELYNYVHADGGVPRQSKQNICKSIERAVEVIKKEWDDEEGDMDSEFEGLEQDGLMEVKVGGGRRWDGMGID